MNGRTLAMLCAVLSLIASAGRWPGAARAEDGPGPRQEQFEFHPGDTVVVRQSTVLMGGAEPTWISPGTFLVVTHVKTNWLATTVEQDGKTVTGWVLGSHVSPVIANSIGMKLVLIPAGEFMMGSAESAEEVARAFPEYEPPEANFFEREHPQHRVRITRPFYLGVCEVTVSQFRKFVEDANYKTDAEKSTGGAKGATGFDPKTGESRWSEEYSWRNVGFEQTDEHPVVDVSWYDAMEFCNWLRRKEGKTYRLPTEAEWEYACRAGTTTRYHHGDDPEGLAAVDNVIDAAAKARFPDWEAIKTEDGYVYTAPVGKFKANRFGLYDMHGNVLEWCADYYNEKYYSKSPLDDPTGPRFDRDRVLRGGSWTSSAVSCRSAWRYGLNSKLRGSFVGFRVALAPAEESSR